MCVKGERCDISEMNISEIQKNELLMRSTNRRFLWSEKEEEGD